MFLSYHIFLPEFREIENSHIFSSLFSNIFPPALALHKYLYDKHLRTLHIFLQQNALFRKSKQGEMLMMTMFHDEDAEYVLLF